MTTDNNPFDVFLSHSHADALFVEELAKKLEDEAHLKVWLDKWELIPGADWQTGMAQGIEQSKTCVICIGKTATKGWFRQEKKKALNRGASDESFRVIPVLLPDSDPSFVDEFLELRTWVDYKKGVADPEAFRRLVAGIKGEAPGRILSSANETKRDSLEYPIFQVPFTRNVNFTGRRTELETLHENLVSTRQIAVTQAITGLGGVGKTQLVVQYAFEYATEYDLVWWVRAEESASISDDFAELANRLNLPIKAGAEQKVYINIVQHWLRNADIKWLLIFDNAENPDELAEILPQGKNGHILITSRNPNWGHLGSVLSVKPFTLEESKEFLFKRTRQRDEVAANHVAEMLGGLPLALEQAAAYIGRSNTPLTTYSALYQEQRRALWDRQTNPKDYKATITTTWELAFQQIQKLSPEAIELLNICIFLAPDAIPVSLFREGVKSLPDRLARLVENPVAFEDAIAALFQYSLIEREGENLSIHRLVQDVARDRLKDKKRQQWIEIVLSLLDAVFSFDKYEIRTWQKTSRLLPHVEAALGFAKKDEAALKSEANLCHKTGEYMREQGEYDAARKNMEQALKIRQGIFGRNHPVVASSLDYLGELYQEQANYISAFKLHEEALMVRRQTLGDKHPETATSLDNLGSLYHSEGKYAEARPYHEEALAINRQALGDKHPDTAKSLNNLGLLYQSEGKYAEARPYHEEALAIRRQALGDKHPDTATSLNNLAGLSESEGKYAEARPYYEEALAINRQALGDKHPDTARSLNNLGYLYLREGKYAGARSYFEEALAIRRQALGDKHPDTANSLNNLAGLYQSEGKYAEARPYFEEALAIRRQALDDKHPDTAKSLNNLGLLYQSEGKYAEARPYFEEALAISRQALGDKHPDTATSLNNLGMIYQSEGKYAEARPYYEEALAINRQALGDKHPDTAVTLNNIGTSLMHAGKYVDARTYLQEALRILEEVHGDRHPALVKVLVNLGQILTVQRQFPLARIYLTRARNICRNKEEQYSECLEVEAAFRALPGTIGRPEHKKKPKKHRR